MGPAGTKRISMDLALAPMITFLTDEMVRPLKGFQILGLEPINGHFKY